MGSSSYSIFAALSAHDLVAGYLKGRFTPTEVAEATLSDIEAADQVFNIYRFVDYAGVRAAAKRSTDRYRSGRPLSSLDGVAIGIKDQLDVEGWPVHLIPSTADTPLAARLREAGAILLGKTKMPQLGMKGDTQSVRDGVTRNPWNRERTVGGSSGGAGAAASLGLGPIQIGTDGGGSIRIPAAFNGVVGLKPTRGLVAESFLIPWTPMTDAGPLARSVLDVATALEIITRVDPRSPSPTLSRQGDYSKVIERGVKGLRIGFDPQPGGLPVDRDVALCFANAVALLRDQGADCFQISMDLGNSIDPWAKVLVPMLQLVIDRLPPKERSMVEPLILETAGSFPAGTAASYAGDLVDREKYALLINSLFASADLIMTPALPFSSFRAGEGGPESGDYMGGRSWNGFLTPFNLSRHPAGSHPAGFSSDGMPVGVQIAGPLQREDLILRAMRSLEKGGMAASLPPPVRGETAKR
jgi:aspartyl-tRNA(Asn)/glutamyl-tRNA(Gln) amidotransferase subunit A